MSNLPQVSIYTDGACSGNPGPGGWGAILVSAGREKELSGGTESTTNNRMELTAAIEALAKLNTPCRVRLFSDSAYLINAFTLGWLEAWKRNGWKNSTRQVVSNLDLWKELDRLSLIHEIDWIKVKGHSGHEYNERCDALAVVRASEYAKPERIANES
ncbi:MAG: ribonuclease HI [Clostridiaceae bacterium]|nr:ribonuclease HI [Oscillospiraceae bacterium]NLO63067.1 ribonuclease HI [Clostridiaceae bacterium]